MSGLDRHQKALAGLLRDNARRFRMHEVYRDFCELCALELSNAVDKTAFAARAERFMTLRGRYEADEMQRFGEMLAELTMSLDLGLKDSMGELFMHLELGDHWKGQFFTPFEVSVLMASVTMGDAKEKVQDRGFIRVHEPACGSGSMVIAMAQTLQDENLNYQQCMHVVAQDIDATAVHMAYVQFSLLHIPAVVVHGNTLTMKTWDQWFTPAHVLGGWGPRLRWQEAAELAGAVLAAPESGPLIEAALPVPVECKQAAASPAPVGKEEQLGLF